MKTVVVVLAEGFEETEAVLPIDLLRRAGVQVRLAGLTAAPVKGARGISVLPDVVLDAMTDDFDALMLPGGIPGANNLRDSAVLDRVLAQAFAHDALVCAICASAAVVLGSKGYLKGRRFTCYPGYEREVLDGHFSADAVVRDGQIITSRGVGTAAAFAFAMLCALGLEAHAKEVFAQTLLPVPA
ncbi:DJ-1 family glyoxalase III [Uliginosibacterium gangwonense]|uniref:DJ-1 family glyoxalase III n=1 Tax=Uliginosibacterium gangwonense TaxID=392736 RepID=UPI000374258F|nr:DJ-1 family glyoxalase III [Uliginosibacterium gangwonense]